MSSKNKLLTAISLGALVCAGVYTSMQRKAESPVSQQVATADPKQVKQPTVASSAVSSASGDKRDDETPRGWALSDADDQRAPKKLREGIPATLIAIDRTVLQAVKPGDSFELSLGSQQSAVMQIADIVNYPEYTTTVLKGFTGQSPGFPAVITLGASSTLATVGTATGTFELVGGGEMGWLYRQGDLSPPELRQEPDYVIPDVRTDAVK